MPIIGTIREIKTFPAALSLQSLRNVAVHYPAAAPLRVHNIILLYTHLGSVATVVGIIYTHLRHGRAAADVPTGGGNHYFGPPISKSGRTRVVLLRFR